MRSIQILLPRQYIRISGNLTIAPLPFLLDRPSLSSNCILYHSRLPLFVSSAPIILTSDSDKSDTFDLDGQYSVSLLVTVIRLCLGLVSEDCGARRDWRYARVATADGSDYFGESRGMLGVLDLWM